MYNELELFGLTPEQSKIYIQLLNHKSLSLNKILSQTNLSRYIALRSLEQLKEVGLISKTDSRPPRYFAIDPQDSFEKLEKNITSKLGSARERLVEMLRPHYLQERKETVSWLTGRVVSENALHYLRELLDNAHSEIILKMPQDDLINQVLFNLYDADKRGVTIRLVLEDRPFSEDQIRKLEMFDLRTSKDPEERYEINSRLYVKTIAIIDSTLLTNIFCHGMDDVQIEMSKREECSICEAKKCRGFTNLVPSRTVRTTEEEMFKVKDILTTEKGLSKRELSGTTGLSGGKVASIVDQLISYKIARIEKVSTGGRPKELVFLKRSLEDDGAVTHS